MKRSFPFLAVVALAAALALSPVLGATSARAADTVSVPDVGGQIWQDGVTMLTDVGLTAHPAGDGIVVPGTSTIADQCPRAGTVVAVGSAVTITVRTTIATCGTGGGGTGGGGAVAFWPLDEASGQTTASDATGTGHDGTYAGAVTLGGPGAPKNGNAAATFSGGDATVPYSADLNQATYSVEAWVNPASVNDGMDQGSAPRSIVCSRDDQGLHGWMLYADNYTGTPQFAFVVGAESSRRYVYDGSGTAEQAGRWYHVAATYDGANLHLYVNGVEVTGPQLNDGDGTNMQPNPTAPLELASCNGGRAPWQGAIQDVAFWNGVLDPATIAAHASGGTPPPGGGNPGSGGAGGGTGGGGGCDPTAARCAQGGGPTHPLILIPGTLGSWIGTPLGVPLWPDVVGLIIPGDHKLRALEFDDSGHGEGGPMPDKGVGGLITTVAKICLDPYGWPCYTYGGHHYDVAVSKLVDGFGYSYHAPGHETSDQTLFTFPYDWRLSMGTNAALLRARIQQVLALTHAPSVDILAHSQGGLVTSAYLRQYNGDGVHRVVTAGTPYVGAAKFLTILAFGFPCEIPGCIISPTEASRVARNWPGALELLPSARYWELLGSPLRVQRSLNGATFNWTLTHPEMLKWLADNGKNQALDDQAATAHAAVDQFPVAATPILRIAGTDTWTIGGVEHQVHKRCGLTNCIVNVVDNPRLVSGDGTVPASSAEVRNCSTGVNLDASANAHSTQRAFVTHDELIRDSAVLAWADTFFRVGAAVPACGDGLSPRRLAAATDAGLSGTTLRTVGALTGVIREGTDVTGTVDPASGMEAEQIPTSAFIPMPGSSTYAVSRDGSFQGVFTATADDIVRLEVAHYANDVETQISVTPSIDVAAHALLSVSYAQPQDLGLLQVQVDDDGNGTVDRTVPFEQPLSGDAVGDTTPPTSTVTVTHFFGSDGRRMARVVIVAQDTGGAGIGDVTWHTMDGLHGTYTGPFVLPAQGDLQVIATDRAGNEQADPSWGVLDDRTGLPYRVTEFKTRELHAVGLVDYANDVDLWGIHSNGGRIRAELVGLFFDAQLELDDASGNRVAMVDERRGRPEKLDVRVPAGDYLLKVTGTLGAHDWIHPYILNATAPGS
jgi:hypothetical protein